MKNAAAAALCLSPCTLCVWLLLPSSGSAALLASAPPGGPYGLAQTPPLGKFCRSSMCHRVLHPCFIACFVACFIAGWRSWNCFHNSVTQAKMEAVMDAMVGIQPGGGGGSLRSLGYESVGLDDMWQACGKGFNGSFHDSAGSPLWNNVTFPDPVSMVAKAHSLKLKAGWCEWRLECSLCVSLTPPRACVSHGAAFAADMNNCDCMEAGLDAAFAEKIYEQSVKMLASQKWDGVKLDGCSQFHNTTKWASLMEATGRPITVENCGNTHPPTAVPDPSWGHDGQCPYNWFRSSTDINPSWASIMNNLASTVRFQDPQNPLSKPGCWAYPEYAP